MPNIFIFAGCNGSGKSTLALYFLSYIDPPPEFVNADDIAARLNPLDVDAVAVAASRKMLERIHTLAEQQADFAFETTLAARTFAKFIKQCKSQNYTINLIYIWLNSPNLAVKRVAARVASGGHNIPHNTIIRRYYRSVHNFFELYSSLADRWIVYDNSNQRQKIAEKPFDRPLIIYQPSTWQQFNSASNL